MRRICQWPIYLTLLFLSSCQPKGAGEKAEIEFWDTYLNKPVREVLYKTEQPAVALHVFDSLYQSSNRSSPFADAARFGMVADFNLYITKDYHVAGLYVDSALSVYHSPEIRKRFARSYVGFLLFGGELSFRLGDYTKSNNYFFQAKQFADEFLTPCERSVFTYNAAMVSYRQENFEQSAAYFAEAFDWQATCPVQTTAIVLQQQEIQSNIGLCLWKLKKYDSALIYFNKAIALATHYKDSLGSITMDKIKGVIYGNMAKIYAATDRPSLAEELYKKSIVLNARPGYELIDALHNQLELAELYGHQKQLPEMYRVLQEAKSGLDTLTDTKGQTSWLRLMATYHQKMDQPLQELHYFTRFVTLKDSLTETQKQLLKDDISRKLKEKEQALKISKLTNENQLNRVYLWLAICLSAMAALIIFLVYDNYRRSRKNVLALLQLNEDLNAKSQELEKANKEKDRILHVIAHDLRNPIGITAYVSDLILMEERNEKDKASLLMIKEAATQALALTDQLLGTKKEREETNFIEKTNVNALLQKAVAMQQYNAVKKDQKILLALPEEKLIVKGNAMKLNRVVSNLLTNAIKFSHAEEQILVQLEAESGQALLTVMDRGIGIPATALEEVFNSDNKVRRPGTFGETSFGLGLSICREILEECGGSIHIQSEDKEGTIMRVRLRLAENV